MRHVTGKPAAQRGAAAMRCVELCLTGEAPAAKAVGTTAGPSTKSRVPRDDRSK